MIDLDKHNLVKENGIRVIDDLTPFGLENPLIIAESEWNKRSLLGSTSPTNTVVSGTGISSVTASLTYTVEVYAKDYSGNSRTTGGDLFYIQITNHCTKTSEFECTAVAGRTTTIHNDIFTLMTDNGDGTYTYSYSVEGDGMVSVAVILFNQNNVRVDWYPNTSLSGTLDLTEYKSQINTGYTLGNLYGSRADSLSGQYQTYLKGPYTGTITFYIYNYDGATVYYDNVRHISYSI